MGKAVVPDLPYDRLVVPDGSEAPQTAGCFAGRRRSRVLLRRSTSKGTRDSADDATVGRSRAAVGRRLTVGLVFGLASALSVVLLVPAASADDLSTRRDHVKQQLATTRSDLNESSRSLTAAAIAVDRTQNRLDVARTRLAQTRKEVA